MVYARLTATFLILWAMWIALTATFDPQELFAGAVVSALVATLSYEILFQEKIGGKLGPGRVAHGLAYIPAYVWAEIKSHLKVIYLILHPRMPIRPGIVKVPTKLKSDFGVTGLADAITMTPGTLSVDVREKESALYVHWIDVKTSDPDETGREIAWPFEKYLRRIFG